MPKSKKSKWERNYANIERLRTNALYEINRLQGLGYEVSSNLRNYINNYQKTRYTEKDVNNFRRLVNKNAIRSRSYKTITVVQSDEFRDDKRVSIPLNTSITARVGYNVKDESKAIAVDLSKKLERATRDVKKGKFKAVTTQPPAIYWSLLQYLESKGYKAYTGTLPTNFNVSTIFKDVKIRPNVIAKIKDPQLLNYVKEELTEILRDPHLTPSGRKEYRKFIGKTSAGTFLHERGFNDSQIDYLVNLIDTSKIWNSLVKTDMDSNQMSNYAKKFNEKVDERVRNGNNDLIDEVIVLLNNEADISEFDNWMNKVAKQTGVNTGIGEPDN